MLVIESVPLPVLNRVIPLAGLDVPTDCAANVRLEVLKLMPELFPVPVSATNCGLPVASSAMERLAEREPAAMGVNVTLIVQLVAAAREVPQVLVCVKSEGSRPVTVMLVRFSVELPELLNVTFWALLLEPTEKLPNVRLVGASVTAGATPVPVRARA
jgi:hypothetical protein